MIGLDSTTCKYCVTLLIQGISQQKLQLTNLKQYWHSWMRQAQFKVTQQLRMHLTLYTLKSVYIFSILFCIHFLKCWCKENLSNNQEHLEAGDHLPLMPMTSMCNPGLICSEKLDTIVTERVSKKNIWDDFDHRYRRNWSYAFPYNLWSLYSDDFKVLLHYSHLH